MGYDTDLSHSMARTRKLRQTNRHTNYTNLEPEQAKKFHDTE
jgi:hypothetical protein